MEEYLYKISVRLDKTSAVKFLNDQILAGINKGFSDFGVEIQETATYSNICAPIAAILDYYRDKGHSFKVEYVSSNTNPYTKHTKLDDPYIAEEYIGKQEFSYPFDKVWKFSSSEGVNSLVNAYLLALRQSDIVEQGVIGSLDWCLNETMDNVLQHSQAQFGYIMAQLARNSKRFSVCVFDAGIGIYNTLKDTKHHPATALDSITLALQERVTRDESVGQGNGLWGLSRIIDENDGLIRICSSGAYYEINSGKRKIVERGYFNLGKNNGSTMVDFQLDYSNKIDITKALNGYEGPIDYWLEKLETDEGEIVIPVSSYSSGTGTRKAAEKLRNVITNIAITDRKKVILDFDGVNLVSSSYADELIGKIISKYGFMFFISRFSIIHISSFNVAVLNRSVGQRLAQTYYDNAIADIDD